MPLELNALETRILGCLIEKERLTPENYPLSLNSLTAACNQTTNRDPITAYDEKAVEEGIYSMREKKLAMAIFGAGSRVQKYRHRFEPARAQAFGFLYRRQRFIDRIKRTGKQPGLLAGQNGDAV